VSINNGKQQADIAVNADIVKKINHYIDKNPLKAFGHYMLGKCYMHSGLHKEAERCFKQALRLESNYTYAIVGLIQCFSNKGEFKKASSLYAEHISKLRKKRIYGIKILRELSKLYDTDVFTQHRGWYSKMKFNAGIKSIVHSIQISQYNIVACVLLASYFLKTHNMLQGVNMALRETVEYIGINDNLRWGILKQLSKEDYSIMENSAIASKFDFIPQHSDNAEYDNKILSYIFQKGNSNMITSAFEYMYESKIEISKQNVWNFIYFSNKERIYSTLLYKCIKHLLEQGWVDRLLYDTIKVLKDLNIVSDVSEQYKIFKLYGY